MADSLLESINLKAVLTNAAARGPGESFFIKPYKFMLSAFSKIPAFSAVSLSTRIITG